MSSFGRLFRVTTFGESHCSGVGVVVDGCPPRMNLSPGDIQPQLTRRRPGQSKLTTARNEADQVSIQSGVEHGRTLGTPISLFVKNKDHRPGDYSDMKDIPRPSHADFTYQKKYGIRASSGGGRSSARETIGRVASGAIAEKWLYERFGTRIVGWVSAVGPIRAPESLETDTSVTREAVDGHLVRCPHGDTADRMKALIEEAADKKDSLGGVVTVVCTNVPSGLGEPVFDKLEAMFAHAMLSIPATKGFEIGSGFEGTKLFGSQHNDPFVGTGQHGVLNTSSNRSGGIQGGISNAQPIVMRIAFKPAATIGRAQTTADFDGAVSVLEAKGRHDPCVLPRAVPIVESMAALVLIDAALMQLARESSARMYKEVGKVRPEHAQWGENQKKDAEAARAKL